MDRRTGKFVISRKTKQAYAETKGTRDHITANGGVDLQVGQFCSPIYLTAGLSIKPIYMRWL